MSSLNKINRNKVWRQSGEAGCDIPNPAVVVLIGAVYDPALERFLMSHCYNRFWCCRRVCLLFTDNRKVSYLKQNHLKPVEKLFFRKSHLKNELKVILNEVVQMGFATIFLSLLFRMRSRSRSCWADRRWDGWWDQIASFYALQKRSNFGECERRRLLAKVNVQY